MPGCRSPHGERGLKSDKLYWHPCHKLSLPTRGAWIEISAKRGYFWQNAVAPHTGSVD